MTGPYLRDSELPSPLLFSPQEYTAERYPGGNHLGVQSSFMSGFQIQKLFSGRVFAPKAFISPFLIAKLSV